MKKLSGKMIAIIASAAVVIIGIVVVLVFTLGNKESYRVIQVHDFIGEINMVREGKKISPAKGMNLKNKDEFELKNSTELELLADSDKHIKALENTEFYISKTGNQNSGKLQFQLIQGTLLVEIENKLKDDEEFEIVTPNAITSVRGTEYSVIYYPEYGITEVSVNSGIVHVESAKENVDVTAGSTVYVLDDDEIENTILEAFNSVSNDDTTGNGSGDTEKTEDNTPGQIAEDSNENTEKTEDDALGQITEDSRENTEKAEDNILSQIAEDGIEDNELSLILYGGANADALKFCISIMQDCILAGNTNYIKAALNSLWYRSKIPGSVEPLSTNGGNTYSVDDLNELFALMTEEKISDAQMPMMAKLEGDEVKYIVCDVAAGGGTRLYDVEYTVNDSMELLVSYNYKKTYGSDGMSGVMGEGTAILAPDSNGKYVIKNIGDMTITEFNY